MRNKNTKYLPQRNDFEPTNKKQKLSDEKDKTILKLELSRDEESNTSKSQLNTSISNNKENSETNSKKSDTMELYNNCNEEKYYVNNDMDYTSTGKIIVRDMSNLIMPHWFQPFSDICLPKIAKKDEIRSTKFFPVSPNTHENNDMDYTSATIESADEPIKVFKSTESTKIGKVIVRHMSELVEPHLFQIFCDICLPKTIKKDEIKSIDIMQESQNTHLIKKKRKQLSISEIERLYSKYFGKPVRDTIVIIANILVIIYISNKHHKARMDDSIKISSETEKLKERYDANKIHLRHKTILESKLKEYFLEVVTEFAIPEFEHAFQIFLLSIINILRVLNQPELKNFNISKIIDLLLWKSLNNGGFDHVQTIAVFKSKTFRLDCTYLFKLIEDSQDSNPGISDRLSLFFVSSVNSEEYFQAVINAATSNSDNDLALFIDNAVTQCKINLKFQCFTDFPSSSTVKNVVDLKAPASATQRPLKSDDLILSRVKVKKPKRTFQSKSVAVPKSKKNSSSTLKNVKASKQLNSRSNSVAKVSNRNTASKLIVPEMIVASSSNVSNGILQTEPTFITLKSALQDLKCTADTTTARPETITLYAGNEPYTVITSTTNQLGAANITQNNVVITPASKVTEPADITLECDTNNCQNVATLMCSTCKSVKYCSEDCQQLDWYEEHMLNCEALYNIGISSETGETNVSD